ncbi:hypothetical protein F5Y14DRAFT_454732 [Nemania sp. NC0429]|nr:hypothetical protein F5Y14DRAFT_454732 [Nemania sp. NC0429]
MSGGPGGGFFVPQSADVYHVGDTILLKWDAGEAPTLQIPSGYWPVLVRMLLLQSTLTSPDVEQTIFNETLFAYEATPRDDTSWGLIDLCGNTQMTYRWTIPADQSAGTDIKYFFQAMNITDSTAPPSLPIGSIVLGLIGLWAWRRRLKAGPKKHSTQGLDSSLEKYGAEMDGDGIVELDGGGIVEADGKNQGYHLDSSHEVKMQGVPIGHGVGILEADGANQPISARSFP